MENKKLIDYINNVLISKLNDIKLIECKYKGQPNNNFYSRYQYKGVTLTFVKDRSFLEVEIFKNNEYMLLHEFDNSFEDIKATNENIDRLVNFIYKNQKMIFE